MEKVPYAGLVFYWDEQQVRVEGRVVKCSDEVFITCMICMTMASRLNRLLYGYV